MGKRKKVCVRFRCNDQPFMAGLCKQHYNESIQKEARRQAGLEALNRTVVDGQIITAGPLREGLYRIQKWWSEVCSADTSGHEHPVLKDDTSCAVDWCIGIAEYIVNEERHLRAGGKGDMSSYKYQRDRLWERFSNLERGLMSNGLVRPEGRR
jgi:hypothetical protein